MIKKIKKIITIGLVLTSFFVAFQTFFVFSNDAYAKLQYIDGNGNAVDAPKSSNKKKKDNKKNNSGSNSAPAPAPAPAPAHSGSTSPALPAQVMETQVKIKKMKMKISRSIILRKKLKQQFYLKVGKLKIFLT